MRKGNTIFIKGYTEFQTRTVAPKFTEAEWEKIQKYLAKTGLKKTYFVRQAILEKLSREQDG